jgi:hypothetical protein
MRPDIYTKAVLTVIAIMLTVIAMKPIFHPDATVQAQSPAKLVAVPFAQADSNHNIYGTCSTPSACFVLQYR